METITKFIASCGGVQFSRRKAEANTQVWVRVNGQQSDGNWGLRSIRMKDTWAMY